MIQGKKFVQKFLGSEMIGFLFGVPVASAYALLLIDFNPAVTREILEAIIFATFSIILFMAFPTNYFLSRGLAKDIDMFNNRTLSKKAAAILFKRLSRLPILHGVFIFMRVTLGAFLISLYADIVLEINRIQAVSIFFLSVYGAYIAGLMAFMSVMNLCQGISEKIVGQEQIVSELLKKKKYYGIGFIAKSILFLIIPVFYSNFSIYLFTAGVGQEMSHQEFQIKLISILIVNIVMISASVILIIASIHNKIIVLRDSLGVFISDYGDLTKSLPCSLSDEFEHISHLINQAVGNFRNLLKKIKKSSSVLFQSTMNLTSSSHEVFTTSNNQAASVKEIVSTMEESDRRSKEIAGHVEDVAGIAEQTRADVEEGFAIIQKNLDKMEEIKKAHTDKIQRIEDLNDLIKSIWDIVSIINSIANQTKIIAFNAELEASSADSNGKNFEIVANEIRRLADGTVESTLEIKNKIQEIQNASNNLIIVSEQGTHKVHEGWELSRNLESVFKKILDSSEISANSANQISESISRQVSGFEQILITLKQISKGIEGFVESTNSTTCAAEALKEIAEDMNKIVKKYVV